MSNFSTNKSDERRKHKRVALLEELEYEGEGRRFRRRLTEISVEGMFIDTPNTFPPGTLLAVKFRLPNSEDHIIANAEVLYVQEKVGMGVKFKNLSPEDRDKIKAFVEGDSFRRGPMRPEFVRSSRIMVKIPVTIEGTDSGGARFAEETTIVTLSMGGASILTSRDLNVGMPLYLCTPKGLRFEARVAWVGSEATGTKGLVGLQCRGLAQALGFQFP